MRKQIRRPLRSACFIQEKLCAHSLHWISFHLNGNWTSLTGRVLSIQHFYTNLVQSIPDFYNTEALHVLAIEIFFKMQKGGARGKVKNIAVTQKARYKFAPEFPVMALCLLVVIVSVANVISGANKSLIFSIGYSCSA